jgi:hypothetical protein
MVVGPGETLTDSLLGFRGAEDRRVVLFWPGVEVEEEEEEEEEMAYCAANSSIFGTISGMRNGFETTSSYLTVNLKVRRGHMTQEV